MQNCKNGYFIGSQRLTKTRNLLRIEEIKRLCNSLFWGTGLRPVAVCKDPPTTLFLAFANCLFDRAECAVMRLTCVSETDTKYRFSPTLVDSAFLTKSCLELASRLNFVIRRCGRVFKGR